MTTIERYGYMAGYMRKQADMMQEFTSGGRTQTGEEPDPKKDDTNRVFMKKPAKTEAELKAANDRFDDMEHEHLTA